MVFPVVGQALVERAIFLGSNVAWVASPDGLHLVELLVLDGLLLDLLGLLVFGLLVLVFDLLDLGLVAVLLGLSLVVFSLLQTVDSSATRKPAT